VSLYASYAVSFLPSSGDQFSALTATTETLKPERFENREVGFKWAAATGLDLTGALYELVRDHSTARDPNDPGLTILAGEERSRGLELGVTGQVTRRWQIVGGYAWQNAKITRATVASVTAGKHVALTPTNTASLWNRIALTEAWAVGLGVVYQGAQFAAIDNAVVLPAFTRVDAGLFWKVSGAARLQVNAENLFDRRYFPTSNGANNIAPGAPRSIRVSLQTRF
jgi:catecholate siderophore receptor